MRLIVFLSMSILTIESYALTKEQEHWARIDAYNIQLINGDTIPPEKRLSYKVLTGIKKYWNDRMSMECDEDPLIGPNGICYNTTTGKWWEHIPLSYDVAIEGNHFGRVTEYKSPEDTRICISPFTGCPEISPEELNAIREIYKEVLRDKKDYHVVDSCEQRLSGKIMRQGKTYTLQVSLKTRGEERNFSKVKVKATQMTLSSVHRYVFPADDMQAALEKIQPRHLRKNYIVSTTDRR